MKLIFTLSFAIFFSSISYAIAQQGKPTADKSAKAAAAATSGKQTPYKPKLNTGTKPPIKIKPEHKQIKTEIGVTGTTTNFTACANITLANATLDFWPTNAENIDNPNKIKKQFVRIEMDLLSNCEEPYTYNFAQFHL